jgi:hypothetical protein
MSVVGDAQQVRHLRAANKSWAVWTMNDDGRGDVFVVRERTGSISVIGGLSTDGVDFSERVVPLPPTAVVSYHVIESSPGVATFLFSDGASVKAFTWDVMTNVVLSAPAELATGNLPSQFDVAGSLRQFYVRDREVKVRVGGGPEIDIIKPSASEALDIDVVRKAVSASARYAGQQSVNRGLALPFLAEADTVLCYDGTVDTVAVTEALPPGVVSYWTLDDADFSGSNALDIVGGNTASLVGTAPASAVGQVGQAREFLGGTGSGYYNAGNPVNLRITGQLSLSWWMRINSLQTHHPISRGYGGEYATVINVDGSSYFYYGTQGGDGYGGPYFGYLLPPGTFTAGVWTHVVWTRDFVNKTVCAYVNGRLVLQKPTQGTAAAVSTTGTRIGNDNLWTNSRFAGRLDDVIVANQAWSAQSVAALYAKGLAGNRASVSGSGSQSRLLDSGPGARHAILSSRSSIGPRGRTAVGPGGDALHAGGLLPVAAAALTIEARLYPKTLFADEVSLISNRVQLTHSSSGVRNDGAVELSYTAGGMLRFRFDTSSATVELRQTSGEKLRFNEPNHVSVSHTFGSGGASFLSVNGTPVPASWFGGSGNESPSPSAGAASFNLGPGDEISGLRVSGIAKTITQIRDHLRGRS